MSSQNFEISYGPDQGFIIIEFQRMKDKSEYKVLLRYLILELDSDSTWICSFILFYFFKFYLVCHRYNNLKNKKKGKKRQKNIYSVTGIW